MRYILLTLALLALTLSAHAQRHLVPEHRTDGVPGPMDNSYVIVWEAVPGAIGYEYVMSDNRFCFKGCAGDTREVVTRDTFATELGLAENTPYYWITRIFFANGDTSAWTLISQFNTSEVSIRPLFQAGPNPLADRQMKLMVDWGATPDIRQLNWTLTDLSGRTIRPFQTILRGASIFRQEDFFLNLAGMAPGMYQLYVQPLGSDGSPLQSIVQKIVLL